MSEDNTKEAQTNGLPDRNLVELIENPESSYTELFSNLSAIDMIANFGAVYDKLSDELQPVADRLMSKVSDEDLRVWATKFLLSSLRASILESVAEDILENKRKNHITEDLEDDARYVFQLARAHEKVCWSTCDEEGNSLEPWNVVHRIQWQSIKLYQEYYGKAGKDA